MSSASGAEPSALIATICAVLIPRSEALPSIMDRCTRASRSPASARSVPRLHMRVPISLPLLSFGSTIDSGLSRESRSETGTIATSEATGSMPRSVRWLRRAPEHMASTTSLIVASAYFATRRRRSSGQLRAANWRAPVIGTLRAECGAANETGPPCRCSARSTVPVSAGTRPVASPMTSTAARTAARGTSTSPVSRVGRSLRMRGSHGAGMPRLSASMLSERRSNRIAPTPSVTLWWILV